MIPVRRGPEPNTLREARWWRLARARHYIIALGDTSTTRVDFSGYNSAGVKATLYEAQHQKCAYCERCVDASGNPIEHLRPKDGAIRPARGAAPAREDVLHYWWLTWSWDNLLFACHECNQSGAKGNLFPINAASAPQLSTQLEQEASLFIDPALQHPMDHLQFRFDGMRWTLEGRDDIGWETIKVLQLNNRQDLLDAYSARAAQVDEALNTFLFAGPAPNRRELWIRLIDNLFASNPRQHQLCDTRHAALIWDMIDQRFPLEFRRRHGLPLPRIGGRLPADPPLVDLSFNADQQRYDEETRWALRAVGKPAVRKKARTNTSHDAYIYFLTAALRAVLRDPAYAPMTAAQLCALLSHPFAQPHATVEAQLRVLEQEGAALVDGQGLWSQAP